MKRTLKTLNIIINEQHSILPQQAEILKDLFDPTLHRHKIIKVPAEGWNIKQRREIMHELEGFVVFVSPIPDMMVELSYDSAIRNVHQAIFHINNAENAIVPRYNVSKVFVFCNDNREKIEINGKIIHKIAEEGWYLA